MNITLSELEREFSKAFTAILSSRKGKNPQLYTKTGAKDFFLESLFIVFNSLNNNSSRNLKSLWLIYELSAQFSQNGILSFLETTSREGRLEQSMALFCTLLINQFTTIPGYSLGSRIDITYKFTKDNWSDFVVFLWVDNMHDIKASFAKTMKVNEKKVNMAKYSLNTFITDTLNIQGFKFSDINPNTSHFKYISDILGIVQKKVNSNDYIIQDLELEKHSKFTKPINENYLRQANAILNRFGFYTNKNNADKNGYTVGITRKTSDVQKINGSNIYLSLDQEYETAAISSLNIRNLISIFDMFDPGRYVKSYVGTSMSGEIAILRDISEAEENARNFNRLKKNVSSAFLSNDFKITLDIDGLRPIIVNMEYKSPRNPGEPGFSVSTLHWQKLNDYETYAITSKKQMNNAHGKRGKIFGDLFQDLCMTGINKTNYFQGSGDIPHIMTKLLLCQINRSVPRLVYDDSTSGPFIIFPKTSNYPTANKYVIGARDEQQPTFTNNQRITNSEMTNLLTKLKTSFTNYNPIEEKNMRIKRRSLGIINGILKPPQTTTTASRRAALKNFLRLKNETALNNLVANLNEVNSSSSNSRKSVINNLRQKILQSNANKTRLINGPPPRVAKPNGIVSIQYVKLANFLGLQNKNRNNSKLRLRFENNASGNSRANFLALRTNSRNLAKIQTFLNIARKTAKASTIAPRTAANNRRTLPPASIGGRGRPRSATPKPPASLRGLGRPRSATPKPPASLRGLGRPRSAVRSVRGRGRKPTIAWVNNMNIGPIPELKANSNNMNIGQIPNASLKRKLNNGSLLTRLTRSRSARTAF